MIEVESITKHFGSVKALDSVSMTARPGNATVVIGPSGGGKSTLLRAISLLDPPDSGKICLDGANLSLVLRNNVPSPIPTISIVFQQLFLWPHLTLDRNVRLPAELQGLSTDDVCALACELGIKDLMRRYPNEVSAGQRQRAALLRALMLKPKYLLLDEVTSSQDIEHIHKIKNTLCRCINNGMGVVLVTHHIGFANQLMTAGPCGTFLFIDEGRVIEAGSYDQFSKPEQSRVRDFFQKALEIN
jgi:ABC-type polar amino acid transport system ATPase subunit